MITEEEFSTMENINYLMVDTDSDIHLGMVNAKQFIAGGLIRMTRFRKERNVQIPFVRWKSRFTQTALIK